MQSRAVRDDALLPHSPCRCMSVYQSVSLYTNVYLCTATLWHAARGLWQRCCSHPRVLIAEGIMTRSDCILQVAEKWSLFARKDEATACLEWHQDDGRVVASQLLEHVSIHSSTSEGTGLLILFFLTAEPWMTAPARQGGGGVFSPHRSGSPYTPDLLHASWRRGA